VTVIVRLNEETDGCADKPAVALARTSRAPRHVPAHALISDTRRASHAALIQVPSESQPLVEMMPDRVIEILLLAKPAADPIDPGFVWGASIAAARVAGVPRRKHRSSFLLVEERQCTRDRIMERRSTDDGL
jgi:hypothetical protein